MKVGNTVVSLLASAYSVAAIGSLGFNIGTRRNTDGQCKTTSDWESDFDTLKSFTDTVRIYSPTDCDSLAAIYPALQSKDFKLFLGVWPTDATHFAADKQALSTYLPQISADHIVAVTVGSEALYRGDLTPEDLASAIQDVKSLVHDIDGYGSTLVGTADSWNVWVNGTNQPAIEASDIILGNAFSYWQGQDTSNMTASFLDDIMQALQRVQSVKGSTDFPFYVGETGWPTDGGNFDAAYPSVEIAQQFYQEAICGIREWGVNTLVFEAFDETWKPVTSGIEGVENHWGVLDGSGNVKYNITCSFD